MLWKSYRITFEVIIKTNLSRNTFMWYEVFVKFFLVSKTTFSLFIDLQQSYKCMATKIDELNFHVSRYKVLFFLLLQSKMKWGGNCLFYSVISNIYHSWNVAFWTYWNISSYMRFAIHYVILRVFYQNVISQNKVSETFILINWMTHRNFSKSIQNHISFQDFAIHLK